MKIRATGQRLDYTGPEEYRVVTVVVDAHLTMTVGELVRGMQHRLRVAENDEIHFQVQATSAGETLP